MDLHSWFRIEMADAEKRVSRGEEPHDVFVRLRKRFDDKYGETVDTGGSDTPVSDVTI